MADEVKCIECGYMYAWDSKGYDIEDCMSDAELLRLRPREEFPFGPEQLISGKPVRFSVGQADLPFKIRHRRLRDTEEFKCYKKGKGLIGKAMECRRCEDFGKLYALRECPYYFRYQMGFSAVQHVELELVTRRARAQEEFQAEQLKQREQANRIAKATLMLSVVTVILLLVDRWPTIVQLIRSLLWR